MKHLYKWLDSTRPGGTAGHSRAQRTCQKRLLSPWHTFDACVTWFSFGLWRIDMISIGLTNIDMWLLIVWACDFSPHISSYPFDPGGPCWTSHSGPQGRHFWRPTERVTERVAPCRWAWTPREVVFRVRRRRDTEARILRGPWVEIDSYIQICIYILEYPRIWSWADMFCLDMSLCPCSYAFLSPLGVLALLVAMLKKDTTHHWFQELI